MRDIKKRNENNKMMRIWVLFGLIISFKPKNFVNLNLKIRKLPDFAE